MNKKTYKFLYNNFNVIDNKFIHAIKKRVILNKLNKFKVCLHKNKNYPVQEMINFNYGFNYYRPHKHLLNINESYHLIEGSMEIYILDDNCKVKKKIKLSAKRKNTYNSSIIFKINKPLYHFVVPVSKWLIYHEVTTGPWSKKFIKYADFSPSKDINGLGINFYKKIKNISKNIKWEKY